MRPRILIPLTAALAASIALAAALPPRALRLQSPSSSVAAGAFHVHSNRSDGSGSIDDIAAAAARAGLQFVVLTDHGNGTRVPDPPSYRSGVLMLDGVEISTAGGHYAVVGMPQAPYPLAGEPRDVVEDVRRLGGFGIAAHVDSPRSELQWTDWSAGADGLEWLSLDTAWRRASPVRLARAAGGYWFRKPEAVASILTRPVAALAAFDELARGASAVAMASTDTHGLWAPSYEACFRTMSTRIELAGPLAGNAAADAQALLDAIKLGRHYSAIDAFATPPAFEFLGYPENGEGEPVRQGDSIAPDARAILQVRAGSPPDARLVLLRDGETVREARAQTMIHQTDGRPGAYRVEVRLPGFDVPWIVSNPIYVGLPRLRPGQPVRPHSGSAPEPRERLETVDVLPPGRAWAVDHDSGSTAAIQELDGGVRFQFELGGGGPRNQFVSLLALAPADVARYHGVTLDAQASRPLRMFVQLVDDRGGSWSRWQRSIYLDANRRTIHVPFSDMRPPPPLDASGGLDALVLVIDTNHTSPGTVGEIVLNRVAYER